MIFYIIITLVIVQAVDKNLFKGKGVLLVRKKIEEFVKNMSDNNNRNVKIIEPTDTKKSATHTTFNSSTFSSMTTFLGSWVKKGLLAILGLWFIFSSYFVINPGERGIILVMGNMNNTIYNEGLHFKIPFISEIIKTNIQTQKFESDADSASKDLQSITTRIAVNGRIDEKSVKDIYRSLGGDEMIGMKVIQPSVQEAVKSVTAKYTAEELITKRTLVSTEIKTILIEKLGKYGIVVGDVNMVNFSFSEDFNQAIERKVKAEQEALAEKNKLETVKYQAQQTIEQAKAQAESIKIQAEAIQSQGGSAYVNLKRVEKRDGKLPTTSLGSEQGLMVNLTK